MKTGFAWVPGVVAVVIALSPVPGYGQVVDKSRVPPVSVYQAMLKANKPTGWVQFRRYNKQQLVYFTALQTMHCRLSEIRYSVNSKALDKRFALVPCNPLTPFSLPSDSKLEDVLIKLPMGAARYVAVQVVWEDGTLSDVAVYEPCKNVGDRACAYELKEQAPDSQSGRALAPERQSDDDGVDVERGNERGGAPVATPSR